MRRYLTPYWSWCLNEIEESSLLIGQQMAAHADQEAVCRSGRGAVRCSIHTHTCMLTYTYCMHLHHHQGRSFTEWEDCRLLLQQGWLEKRDTATWIVLTTCSHCEKLLQPNLRLHQSMRALLRWRRGVGTWLCWPQDSSMASPRHYGHSARDIANVMQRLQGRCKMLTHSHCSTLVCSVFRGDPVLGMTQQNSMSLKYLIEL